MVLRTHTLVPKLAYVNIFTAIIGWSSMSQSDDGCVSSGRVTLGQNVNYLSPPRRRVRVRCLFAVDVFNFARTHKVTAHR